MSRKIPKNAHLNFFNSLKFYKIAILLSYIFIGIFVYNNSEIWSRFLGLIYYLIYKMRIVINLMAGVTGLEPATYRVTGDRSNQLSYTPILGGSKGLEPLTPSV